MTKIIVDSTCDLPPQQLEKYGIITVPMLTVIGDREYRDKIDISPSEVYEAMSIGIAPKTAQVDVDYLGGVFENCCQKDDDFIYIAFSSAMSCTCHTAQLLLEDFKERFPERNMAVIDSKGGSVSTGLIALQAAKLLGKKYSFSATVGCIGEMSEHVEHIFTIMDLKWLIKGGRLDPIAGAIGTLLGVKPVMCVKNGNMAVLKKVRGRDKAVAALVDAVTERIKDFPEQLIGIAHTGSTAAADALQKALSGRLADASFVISEIGSVLASHLGMGALGVFFFNKKFAYYIT